MDKTYAETRNQPPFDWNKALDNPPERHSDKHFELMGLSASWVTCACGNQCAIIFRGEDGVPEDELLKHYGAQFNWHVYDTNWPEAKRILSKIEARAAVLISEELKKLNK